MRCCHNDCQRIDGAVGFALLEITFNERHLIGDVSETQDRLAARLAERRLGKVSDG